MEFIYICYIYYVKKISFIFIRIEFYSGDDSLVISRGTGFLYSINLHKRKNLVLT